MEQEKTSGLHKDIKYTTRENGEVSGFRFTSDEGREKFRQMQILNVLKMEVMSTMGIRFYRGSIVNVLKSYFPDIHQSQMNLSDYYCIYRCQLCLPSRALSTHNPQLTTVYRLIGSYSAHISFVHIILKYTSFRPMLPNTTQSFTIPKD